MVTLKAFLFGVLLAAGAWAVLAFLYFTYSDPSYPGGKRFYRRRRK